jgi:hypothetical protein
MSAVSKRMGRGSRLVIAFGMLAAGLSGTSANASIVVASDFALPIWQGSVTGAAGPGHQIDCTSANVNFFADACTVDIRTVTTGANCAIEIITVPAATTAGTSVPNTPCAVAITGPMVFTQTAAGCVYVGTVLSLSWTSGVSSQLFHAKVPVSGLMVPTSNAANWLLKLTSYSGLRTDQAHVVTFRDTLGVRFTRSVTSCPGRDLTTLKANVYDVLPNRSITGSDGFLEDVVGADEPVGAR